MATKKSRTSKKRSNDSQKKLLALVLIILFIGLGVFLVVSSFAAKGGGSTNYNLRVVLATTDYLGNPIVGDKNGDGSINYNDIVQYKFTWPGTTDRLIQVNTTCNQNGKIVLSAGSVYGSNGSLTDTIFPWEQDVYLATPSWVGGAADCTAQLTSAPVAATATGSKKVTILQTIQYHVNP